MSSNSPVQRVSDCRHWACVRLLDNRYGGVAILPNSFKPTPTPSRFQSNPDRMVQALMSTTNHRRKRPQIHVRKVRGMGRGVFAGRHFLQGRGDRGVPRHPGTRGHRTRSDGKELDHMFRWGKGRPGTGARAGLTGCSTTLPAAQRDVHPAAVAGRDRLPRPGPSPRASRS